MAMKREEFFRASVRAVLAEAQKAYQSSVSGSADPSIQWKNIRPAALTSEEALASPQPPKVQELSMEAPSTAEEDVIAKSFASSTLKQPYAVRSVSSKNTLFDDLNPRGMRRALILSEILAPPLAHRSRR